MKPLTNWEYEETSQGCMYDYCGKFYEGAPVNVYFSISVTEGRFIINQNQMPFNPTIPMEDIVELMEHLIERGWDDQSRTE